MHELLAFFGDNTLKFGQTPLYSAIPKELLAAQEPLAIFRLYQFLNNLAQLPLTFNSS